MPPKGDKNRKKSDDTGEDEEIVMRVMEALTDERIAKLLRKMLHPRELIDRMDAMGRSIDNLTTQLASKEETISKLEKKIEALENSVDDTEQYTRRSNLIFRGFAELGRGEDTDARILALVNDETDLAPPLQLADIARSHRLGAPRPDARSRAIIVRFTSDRVRDTVYRARTKLKDFNARNRNAQIYINDDLTTQRSKLAYECRKLKKEKRIADTWTFTGKILIKDTGNKITEIRSTEQLRQYQA